jgi:hypothetical protein
MIYVEALRIRKSLIWHIGVLAVIAIGFIAIGDHSTVHVASATGPATTFTAGMTMPLGVVASIAAFFAAIFASSAGISLNRENQTRDISWTKPLSRTALAVQYIAVDLGGILVAFAFAFAAIVVVLLWFHIRPYADASFGVQALLGAGIGTMWYALLQLLSCGFGPGARALSGILWPVALVLAGLHSLPGPAGAIVRAVDVLNPLVYLNNSTHTAGGRTMTISAGGGDATQPGEMPFVAQAPAELRALLVWLFTLAFVSVAIAIWPKKEA